MKAGSLAVVLLSCPLLLAQEEVSISPRQIHAAETLVLRLQLYETQLQALYLSCYENSIRSKQPDLKLQLAEVQQETVEFLDSLYNEAGLNPEEYSVDFTRKVFFPIEQEQ